MTASTAPDGRSAGPGLRVGLAAGPALFTLVPPIDLGPIETVDGMGAVAALRAGIQFNSTVGLFVEPRLWLGTFERGDLTGYHGAAVLEFGLGKYVDLAFGPAVGQNQLAGVITPLAGALFRLGIDLARTSFFRRGSHGLSLFIEAQPMFYRGDIEVGMSGYSLGSFPSLGSHTSVAMTLSWERR